MVTSQDLGASTMIFFSPFNVNVDVLYDLKWL